MRLMSSPLFTLDRRRSWLAFLPLIFLLGAAYWLNLQVQPLPPKEDSSKRHDPDFIVDNFSAMTLNELGTPRFIVAAQKMVHYPDDSTTMLEAPRVTSLSPGSPTLYASATSGSISGKGDEIFLRDDVKITREASATQSEMVFTTTYLHVLPELDLADTDQPVTLVDANNRVTAVGMHINNKIRVINLLAQVNSEHDVAKK